MTAIFNPGYIDKLLAVFFLLSPATAQAARPFVTDDARTVDPGGCQIESFIKQQRTREAEFWFLPACNPLGNAELTLGGYRISDSPGTTETSVVQVKTLLRPLTTNDFGLAVSLGGLRTSPAAPRPRWNPFVNLITSVSLGDDAVVLHFNAGAAIDHNLARTRATFGAGSEIALTGRLYGIAEIFGQETERPSKQLGLRYWMLPNQFQVDTTLGMQRGRRWISAGVRWLF